MTPENPKITETILQVFLRSMARKPDPDKSHCGAGQWTIFWNSAWKLEYSISKEKLKIDTLIFQSLYDHCFGNCNLDFSK